MKVLITGSTGMVGKGVLLECIEDERISEIVLINRKPIDINSEKITEVIVKDYGELVSGEIFDNLDGCFHCMGISSIGLSEEKFSIVTFDLTKILVDLVFERSPQCVFNYVSGTGTDSSEKGKTMWARVKGKTENYVLNKGFKDAYAFRPGAIVPEKGIKSSTGWYNAIYVITRPLFPLMKKVASITTTTRIGTAMINSIQVNQALKHLEGKDINELAK